ncbi:DUF2752 domain-containing protein [Leeuwenhoekiella sp. A16]|uniref:DUF2752 domain-containing protein n=1 Tax=unclassified Leeuwenhoekiella TaxID=2615029 RepID=UPI003A80BF31
MEKYMLPCLVKKYLGFECVGCGLQRSLLLLFEGRFADSFHMYPAIYPLVLLIGYTALSIFIKLRFSPIITPALAIISVLTMVVSYCLKFIS